MTVFFTLVKRNMMVYYKDKGNVFFSFLSMLIILGLMVLFLGEMNVDAITALLDQYGGIRDSAVDLSNAKNLILNWVAAGIIVVNSITIAIGVVGIMIADEEEHKLAAFMISPVNKISFLLSYLVASCVMSFLFCMMTVMLTEGYLYFNHLDLLTMIEHVTLLCYLVVVVFFSSSLVFLIAQFVHSKSAYSGLSTVVGTLVGFLAAIYVPIGSLPEIAGKVLKSTPLFAATALLRDLLTGNLLAQTFLGVDESVVMEYKEYMGITIMQGDLAMTSLQMILFLSSSGLLFFILSVFMMSKRKMKDR